MKKSKHFSSLRRGLFVAIIPVKTGIQNPKEENPEPKGTGFLLPQE